MRIKSLMMPAHLKKCKVLYLFAVVVAGVLFLSVYRLKSGNNMVDLHQVYAEQQDHVRYASHEGGRLRGLPQLNNVKSWERQPDFAKNQFGSRIWKPDEGGHNTRIKTYSQMQNYLQHRHDDVQKEFPVIRSQPNLANDLGIDVDDLDVLRQKVEANKPDIYVDLNQDDFQQASNGLKPMEIRNVRRVRGETVQLAQALLPSNNDGTQDIQTGKALHRYLTTTARPAIQRKPTQTSRTPITAKTPTSGSLLQPMQKGQLPSARHQMEQLVMQLSHHVTDSNGQLLLQRLNQMKHLLPDSQQSASSQAQNLLHQEVPNRRHFLPDSVGAVNEISVPRNQSRGRSHLPDLHSSAGKAKYIPVDQFNQQNMPLGQDYQFKPPAPGMKVMQYGNVGDENNQQIYIKRQDHVNVMDHQSLQSQHNQVEGQDLHDVLGHRLQHSQNMDQINIDFSPHQHQSMQYQVNVGMDQRQDQNIPNLVNVEFNQHQHIMEDHVNVDLAQHQQQEAQDHVSVDLGQHQQRSARDHINEHMDQHQQPNLQENVNTAVEQQNIRLHSENNQLLLAPLPRHHQVEDTNGINNHQMFYQKHEPIDVLRGNALNRYLHQSVPHNEAAPGRPIPLDKLGDQVIDKKAQYTLMHAGRASQAQGDYHSKLEVLPKEISQEAYIYEDTGLPTEPRLRPSIGNGHLATVIYNPHMFMSGFYNGYKEQSHRAEIPSTLSVRLDGIEPETNCSHKYKLNVGEGIFSELCTHKFYSLELRIYAHRTIQSVMVVEVELAMASYYPMTVKLRIDKWHVSGDVTFSLQQIDDMKDVSLKSGHISAPETRGMPYDEAYILYDHIPSTLKPPSGSSKVKWVFLTVVGASKNEVIQTYNKASTLIHSGDKLYTSHIEGWADLWRAGYIDISGNLTIAKAVFSSMYYLLSSVPMKEDSFWPFVGLSPSGLPLGDFSHPQDYKGHIFCDQELWMLPPLVTFYPELAKIVLRSRSRYAAKKAAAQLAEDGGVKSSLKYPWQTGISGTELTDPDDPYRQSVFTSGLISQAVLSYLHATNDTSLLMDQQYGEILISIANYYYKLLQDNGGGSNSFGITGIQAMDKYARSVNNSIFTNAVTAIALSAPEEVYKMIGRTINLNYHHYSKDIYIPFDASNSYHLEHTNYIRGHPISQADVVLVGYPLMREMTSKMRKNDLEIYEKVLDTQTPPMSWSMYAIGWLEVGNIRRAIQAFDKQFPYLLGNFQIWTEKGTSLGAANYLSAAGSFIQSITNGFLGLRYYDNYLTINPVVPPGAEYMRFVGINYLGSSLEIWVWQTHMAIQVMAGDGESEKEGLKVFTNNPLFVKILVPGHAISIARTEARIMPRNAELPV